jgi:hypothetical protein
MKITNKHINELKKQYVGKRIMLDEEYNYGDFAKGLVGIITEVSPFGQLKFDVDGGGFIYLTPDDRFHEINN